MALAVTPTAQGGPEVGFVTAAAVWNAEDSHSDLSDLLVIHEGIPVTELGTLAGREANDVRCALQLFSSSRERRQVLAALSSVPGLSNVVGVEAPLAIFASHWHHNSTPAPDQPLRVIALEDGGVCSVLVAHTGQRRILSLGIVKSAAEIQELTLKAVRASEASQSEPIVDGGAPWETTVEMVETVQTIGVGDAFGTHFHELFGPLVTTGDASHAVLYGLTRIEALADWTASWPTTRVHLGDGWTRQPGPLGATFEEHLVRLRPAAGLRFTDGAGRDVTVRAGSVSAKGCVIPDRLGTQPRLRLVDDGRLLMLGPPGTRPLAIELAWPIPASRRSSHIDIRSASAVGVELTEPWVAPGSITPPASRRLFPSGPKNVGDIDPELGRHS